MLRKLRLDEEHQMSQVAADEPECATQIPRSVPASRRLEDAELRFWGRSFGARWDHLGYLRRSPSPCRLRRGLKAN